MFYYMKNVNSTHLNSYKKTNDFSVLRWPFLRPCIKQEKCVTNADLNLHCIFIFFTWNLQHGSEAFSKGTSIGLEKKIHIVGKDIRQHSLLDLKSSYQKFWSMENWTLSALNVEPITWSGLRITKLSCNKVFCIREFVVDPTSLELQWTLGFSVTRVSGDFHVCKSLTEAISVLIDICKVWFEHQDSYSILVLEKSYIKVKTLV